jgi:hypothetical protein
VQKEGNKQDPRKKEKNTKKTQELEGEEETPDTGK